MLPYITLLRMNNDIMTSAYTECIALSIIKNYAMAFLREQTNHALRQSLDYPYLL
jgi:hypothetical protein